MKRFHFTDPFPILPLLERKMIELRSFESSLSLFYAESMKKRIIDMVTSTEAFRNSGTSSSEPRLVEGEKDAQKKALKIMVDDQALTQDEANELVSLINFRNDIGHRIDELFSEFEQTRFTATDFDLEARKFFKVAQFDHTAIRRFDAAFSILDRAARTHFNVMSFYHGGWLYFSSTEKVLKQKIQAIRRQIPSLISEREDRIKKLNSDAAKAFAIVQQHGFAEFNLRYPLGQMTRRGAEICYRLFDEDIDELVICQIYEMKLPAIRYRKLLWDTLGGSNRPRVNFDQLPETIVPSKYDDE